MKLYALVCDRRGRRALQGLAVLRRTYERASVMAALEGGREVRRPYYQDYVDALEIIGVRAEWIA
jgi:hypothetical protein